MTSWIIAHRRLVLLAWLVVAAGGAVLAPRAIDRLSYAFDLPGYHSTQANDRIAAEFDSGGRNDPILLVARPARRLNDTARTDLAALQRAVERALPGARTASALDGPDGARLVGRDGRTIAVVVYPRPDLGADAYATALRVLQRVARDGSIDGARPVVTGVDALAADTGQGQRGVLIETLFGGLGALIVLALVFGSLLAVLPLLVAAASILATFVLVFGLSEIMDVSFIVQYLIALIGLGVAIDYSLLVVTRWREAQGNGEDAEQAVRTAMTTAGRSVAFSGVTVGISLVSLLLLPVPFLRSVGITGLMIPLLSVLAASTLLPALLVTCGTRLSWPHRRRADPHSRLWHRVATLVRRAPAPAALAAAAVLVLFAWPALGLRLGAPNPTSLAHTGAAATALRQLDATGVPPGVLQPVQIITGDPAAVTRTAHGLRGVSGVITPSSWQHGATSVVDVWTADVPSSPSGAAAVRRIVKTVDRLPDTVAGGLPASDRDFVSASYGNLWLTLGLVGVVTFLLLARAFRSVLLPLKALALNTLSIAAAYGLTVWIWQDGHLTRTLFGTSATGAVTTWVPVAVFAFLFGLSMDYEVFILTRAREVYDRTGDTGTAIDESISTTGRLVTSAALILFLAFVALGTVPVTDVKVFATALALGIALDAILVRTILTPALVVLLGPLNWTAPHWLAGRPTPQPSTTPQAEHAPRAEHHPRTTTPHRNT